MKVTIPDELGARIEEYVKRDPKLYHSVPRFVKWAVENDLQASLDIEEDKLSEAIWKLQKTKARMTPELREHIRGFVEAGKKADWLLYGIDTVDKYIREAKKHNLKFKGPQKEDLGDRVIIYKKDLDNLLVLAERMSGCGFSNADIE